MMNPQAHARFQFPFRDRGVAEPGPFYCPQYHVLCFLLIRLQIRLIQNIDKEIHNNVDILREFQKQYISVNALRRISGYFSNGSGSPACRFQVSMGYSPLLLRRCPEGGAPPPRDP